MNSKLKSCLVLLIGVSIGVFLQVSGVTAIFSNNSITGYSSLESYLSDEEKDSGAWKHSTILSTSGFLVVKDSSEDEVSLWVLPEDEPFYPQVRMDVDQSNLNVVVYDSEVKSMTFESDRKTGKFNFYSFSPLIDPNADSIVDTDVDGEYDVVLNLTENKLKLARIDGKWHELDSDSIGLFVDIEGEIRRVSMRDGKCYFEDEHTDQP